MKQKKFEEKSPVVSTDSLFEDIGFSPAEALELKIKSEIYIEIMRAIGERGYTQSELARKLGIHQPDASFLMNGKVSKFSVGRLIHFAAKLDLNASIKVSSAKRARLPRVAASAGKKTNAAPA